MEQIWKEAAQSGNLQALYSLFGQNPNLLEDIDKISLIDTPLHIAASAGHTFFALEILTLMPSFGKKLNPDGLSPLHLALQNRHISTVYWLVRHDPELIRVQGRNRFTPMHYLAEVGDNIDLLKTFVSSCPKSIEDWTVEGETAAHIAVRRGHARALVVLLSCLEQTKSEHILDWLDYRGYAVLHVAAAANDYEVVSLLMKKVNITLKTSGSEGLKATDLATDQRVIDMLRGEELESTLKPQISFTTRLIKCLLGAREEISSIEQVNALLVVAALIVTTTFQAVLSPPGRVSSGGDNSDSRNTSAPAWKGVSSGGNNSDSRNTSAPAGKGQTDEAVFNIFLFVNSIAFLSSLTMIDLLVKKAHNSRLLKVSTFCLNICYGFSLGTISPRTNSTSSRVFDYGLSAISGFLFLFSVISKFL